MNQYRWAFHTVIIAIVLLGSSRNLAQQNPATSARAKLAIEIVDGRKRRFPAPVLESPSEGGFIGMGPTKRLANWKPTENTIPLTGIHIRSIMEGDAVRIKVAGVFDDTEPVDAPGPKYGPVERAIASYLAREGETVTITELTSFGLEPVILKIVKAVRIEDPPLSSEPPQVINNLNSVRVVSFVPHAQLPNLYRLTVQNNSPKNIVAVDVYQPASRGRSSVTASGYVSQPLIKPGATYETAVSESRGGRMTDQGYVPEQPSHKIVIGTVVFDDETYEGEAEIGVGVIGEQIGRRMQIARALPLLQKILESPDRDPVVMLDRLKVEVSGLRIDADGQIVERLLSRFPELPKSFDRKTLTSIVMRGLTYARGELLYHVRVIEEAHKHNPLSTESMWQRLNSLKEQLETQAKENELSR